MRDELESIVNLALRVLVEGDGVTAIEYGLVAALIALACLAGLTATGGSVEAAYVYWSSAVSAAL